jgi:DNA-binding IclR family transcriptional regulator
MAERDTSGDIQVIARCAQILRQLEPGSARLRLGPLATELGMGRSTLHRYLSSMVNADLLERVGDGEYAAGPLLAQLGTIALHSLQVLEHAGPIMRELRDEVHETAVLSVWGGLGPVVVRVEPPNKLVQVLVRTGSQLPIDAAQTRVFLAFMQDRALVERLVSLSPYGREQIDEEVSKTRQEGILVVNRVVEGLRTMAIPIFDGRSVVASLALIGTTSAIPEDTRGGLAQALIGAGERLSRQVGYRGSYPVPKHSPEVEVLS